MILTDIPFYKTKIKNLRDMNNPETTTAQEKSKVSIKLLDPLGNGIPDLKYQIKEEVRIVAKGVTDKQGRIRPFISNIGSLLTLYVEKFSNGEMKKVKTLIPWSENFSVKVLSGKIKQEIDFRQDRGDAGSYKRKTCTAKENDTLLTIAAQHGTTAELLAALNGMTLSEILSVGQVIKLPCTTPSSETQGGETGKSTSDTMPPPVGPFSKSGEASNEPTPPTSAEAEAPNPTTKDQSASAQTNKEDERGENGTPKATLNQVCDQSGCIKLGDIGPLVEEINIRLTGFGGTIALTKRLDEFTEKTEQAVKQFQRDYMGVAETGKVCGAVLKALDDFLIQHPVKLADMKCKCGKCNGFGNGYKDSSAVGMYQAKGTPFKGTEYPGIHRGLVWAFRAALFYISIKDKALGYSFLRISSGYRCWYKNKEEGWHTINHMGNALDLQFRKGDVKTRCSGVEVDNLREKIFSARLGAKLGGRLPNTLWLEPANLGAKPGATSWVHVDVTWFSDEYKTDRYYATTQEFADGDLLVEIAKREGRLNLINCGGIPLKLMPIATDRLPIDSLRLSQAGFEFIKDWEKFEDKPYDNDSKGYCTVGYGHLIEKKRCKILARESHPKYEKFKLGLSEKAAWELLKKDVSIAEKLDVFVQVPLYQHEFDALVSLSFNTGGLAKFSKLLAKINTKDYSGCCDEFSDITNKGTPGLVLRRQAEMKMFRNNVYDSRH